MTDKTGLARGANWLEALLLQPLIAALGGAATVGAGVLASFYPTEIKENYWPTYQIHDVALHATGFFVSIILAVLIFLGTPWAQRRVAERTRREFDEKAKLLESLVRRLESLPPEDFLAGYQELVRRATAVTLAMLAKPAIEQCEQCIRTVLGAIVEIAQRYDKASEGTEYHANVMLFRGLRETEAHNPTGLPDGTGDHPDYVGCLELVPSLSTNSRQENFAADASIISMVLLIPRDTTPTRDRELKMKYPVLPGAPWSFVYKEFAGFPDIRMMNEWLDARGSMSEKAKHDVRFYFSDGAGAKISSLASMPLLQFSELGADNPPIGVLNLHSDAEGILEEKGAERFSPLLEPFRQLLSILLVVRESVRTGKNGGAGNAQPT